MVKKRNKKKGSTLVIVLSVAIIMMLLSSVIANSIMGTMKSNTNQREREDLKYAAESGLEIARGHFAGGNTTIDTRSSGTEDTMDDILSGGIVDRVDVFMDKQNGKDVVKSIAHHIDGTSQEIIMTKYKKIPGTPGNGDIFDHGVIGGDGGIKVETGGNSNMDTSVARPNDSDYKEEIGGTTEGSPVESDSNLGNIQFIAGMKKATSDKIRVTVGNHNALGFQHDKKNLVTDLIDNEMKYAEIKLKMYEWTGTKYAVNLKVDASHNTELSPSEYIKSVASNKYVVRVNIDMSGSRYLGAPQRMDVVFISANDVEITPDSSSLLELSNTMIICSDNVKIERANKGTDLLTAKLLNSTILGKSVKIEAEGSLHVIGQPSYKEKQVGNTTEGSGFLEVDEETELNKIFNQIFTGGNNPSGGGGTADTVVFEENSFSN